MKFVKDERVYLDLTNKQLEERKEKLRNKVESLNSNIKYIQRKIRKII